MPLVRKLITFIMLRLQSACSDLIILLLDAAFVA